MAMVSLFEIVHKRLFFRQQQWRSPPPWLDHTQIQAVFITALPMDGCCNENPNISIWPCHNMLGSYLSQQISIFYNFGTKTTLSTEFSWFANTNNLMKWKDKLSSYQPWALYVYVDYASKHILSETHMFSFFGRITQHNRFWNSSKLNSVTFHFPLSRQICDVLDSEGI